MFLGIKDVLAISGRHTATLTVSEHDMEQIDRQTGRQTDGHHAALLNAPTLVVA